LKAQIKAKKKKLIAPPTKMSEELYKIARRKFGTDTRLQPKFVDLALKV